jgi:hypothetical protein
LAELADRELVIVVVECQPLHGRQGFAKAAGGGLTVRYVRRIAHPESDKACNLHVAQRSFGAKAMSSYLRRPIQSPGRQTILKYQEKTMNDMADPQIIRKVNALIQKNDEALNKNDAACLRRDLRRRRGFCDGYRTGLRPEGHREMVCRRIPALAL